MPDVVLPIPARPIRACLVPAASTGHSMAAADHMVEHDGCVAAGQSFPPGTKITVIGTVQTYQGKKELMVQSASDIVVTE